MDNTVYSEHGHMDLAQWMQGVELPAFEPQGALRWEQDAAHGELLAPPENAHLKKQIAVPMASDDFVAPVWEPVEFVTLRPPVWLIPAVSGAAVVVALIPLGISLMARETWEVRPGQSIAAAIAKARGGDTVLVIGRHTESFVIDKGIILKGKSDAEIRGSDSPIVRVRAHGVRIEGLTFHQSATDGPRGVGLVTIESGRAEVHRSKFSGGRSGLCVKGHAHADLVENTIERSGLYGVMYLEHASGEARKNRVRSNVNNGMGAVGDSSPRFVDNVVERNGRAGIVFFERARGEAIGNLCRYNGRHGIVVDADAAPSLQRNRTVDNVGPGIGFYAQSSGHASGNDIHGNGSGGLLVKQDARPDTHSNNEYNNRPDTGRF